MELELDLDLELELDLDREVEIHGHQVNRERSLVKKEAARMDGRCKLPLIPPSTTENQTRVEKRNKDHCMGVE